MDTPKKTTTQIGTPVSKSKFEDSPVFNYINSLSPIKPLKSIPIVQTFSSLSFASPPSVFTSPHVNSHKESRFFRSHHHSSDPSKSESTSRDESMADASSMDEEASIEPSNDNFEMELLQYDYTTPEASPCIKDKTEVSLIPSVPQGDTVSSEVVGIMDLQKENDIPEWENLIFRSHHDDSEAFNGLMQLQTNNFTSDNHRINGANDESEAVVNIQRGMRRRCLDFEATGKKRNEVDDNISNSRCILPNIGLHLNAIAMSSKDIHISGKIQVSLSGVNALIQSTDQEIEDLSKATANEELNPNSPKKKRLRFDHQSDEGESCKRCNCKKSKCLKLYCECFAAGVYCIEPCSCVDCFNKPIHEDTVLTTRKQIESRNPLAFAPKVIRSFDSISESRDDSSKTPASARHKRGCNCKKSNCLKKYCECYQGGVGCSINCRCEGCKNAFGRKDGDEEEENETSENRGTVKSQTNGEELNQTSTPLPLSRTSTIITENETEDLREILFRSSITTVTAVSPNGKRVSPSRSIQGGRKLILQSIPPFPSLNHNI